jgi:DNA mismatch repair ATPase MutS
LNQGRPFGREVTEVFTASTFLNDLYDDRNRTFSILVISKTFLLQLIPIKGLLSLIRVAKNEDLNDLIFRLEPFEIILDENDNEDIINVVVKQYLNEQRNFQDNPVRLEIIKTSQHSGQLVY